MKLKQYINKTFCVLIILLSSIINAQIDNQNEFLLGLDIKDISSSIQPCDCPSADDVDDFSFNWGSGFNTAFNNLALLETAKTASLRAWYKRQQSLITDEIEEELGKNYNSFNEAKNAYFSHIENRNLNNNKPPIRSKYSSLYHSGTESRKNYLRELKSIQIRESEIKSGNINNSQFPFLKVNGIPLKDITTLNSLYDHRNTIEDAFTTNQWKTHEYYYIVQKLDFLGSAFDNEMLRLKHEYHDGFSEWDRLGLMQFLLNYEAYKDIINCYVCVLPSQLAQFRNSDMATEPVIEDYAKRNRGGEVSLFDPRYPEINRFLYQNNFCGGYIDLLAWEADKQAALDEMLDNTTITEFKFRNFVNELDLEVLDYITDYRSHTLSSEEFTLIQQKVDFIYSKIDRISDDDIEQLSIADQQKVMEEILFVSLFPWLKELTSQMPTSVEEWKVLFEILKPILLEIGIEFIPLGGVYNSAIDTLNGINSGDTSSIVYGVIGIIVEFTPFDQIKNLIQLVRYSKKGFKIFKLTRKFTNVISSALANGVEIALEGSTVIFKKAGSEVARIVNNVMTYKYTGFGGDIVTNPYKTTAIIGKWENSIEHIWASGLAKQGVNNGGMNIFGNLPANWSSLNVSQRWNINREWLDNVISRGDIIRATSDPLDIGKVFYGVNGIDINAFSNINALKTYLLNLTPSQVNQLRYYGREIRHLFQNGYNFDSRLNKFIK